MKTLVIHPKDISTDFLSPIYEGHGWTVIRHNVSKSVLKREIKLHDRIIMLGHGTHQGLIGFGAFAIDSTFVYLLRQKDTVCVWCNADEFVKKYDLRGFYTGMIISEPEEARLFCVPYTAQEIAESNYLFANAVALAIGSSNPEEVAKTTYLGDSPVTQFNRENIYYRATVSLPPSTDSAATQPLSSSPA
jgi:hypothetical protein